MLIHNAFLSNEVPNSIMKIDEGIVGNEMIARLQKSVTQATLSFLLPPSSAEYRYQVIAIKSDLIAKLSSAPIALLSNSAISKPSITPRTSSLSTQLRRLLLFAAKGFHSRRRRSKLSSIDSSILELEHSFPSFDSTVSLICSS